LLMLGLLWSSKDSWRLPFMRQPTLLLFLRRAVTLVGLVFVFQTHAWVSYVAFVVAALLRGRDLVRGPVLVSCSVIVVGMTAIIHAVFFGAGRYGMVTFPLLAGVAILTLAAKPGPADEVTTVESTVA